jgi:crotonobetainyl-CoA:carnitine CoA-transferase CaiB-like acyl-CoA transferase
LTFLVVELVGVRRRLAGRCADAGAEVILVEPPSEHSAIRGRSSTAPDPETSAAHLHVNAGKRRSLDLEQQATCCGS